MKSIINKTISHKLRIVHRGHLKIEKKNIFLFALDIWTMNSLYMKQNLA